MKIQNPLICSLNYIARTEEDPTYNGLRFSKSGHHVVGKFQGRKVKISIADLNREMEARGPYGLAVWFREQLAGDESGRSRNGIFEAIEL
jgi:hypothetical protein